MVFGEFEICGNLVWIIIENTGGLLLEEGLLVYQRLKLVGIRVSGFVFVVHSLLEQG